MTRWHTPHVAQVPSAVVRLSAPPGVAALLDDWAAAVQLPREEALEILLRSRLATDPADPAGVLWQNLSDGQVQTVDEVSRSLAEAYVTDLMVGVRMGPARPDATDTQAPWPRAGLGVDLADSPEHAWPQIRGLWRMKMRPQLLVGLRLGWPGWVYRVDRWETHAESGRSYAVGGYAIMSDGRQIDMQTGHVSSAADADVAAVRVLQSRPIRFSVRSVNPVVRLTF